VVNVHIHQFEPGGAAVDAGAVAQRHPLDRPSLNGCAVKPLVSRARFPPQPPDAVVRYDWPPTGLAREIIMLEQTGEKAEVKMYSDFKSPYAYLAFDPGMTLGRRFNVRVRWIPFQLRLKGKGERSVYSEYKVKYSYMDARRWAKPRGLWIRGPLKVYDTTPAAIGGLFAETQGRLLDFGRTAFKKFFLRELEADQPEAVARLIADIGLSDRHYLEYLAEEGREAYDRSQAEAAADHVFGVPFFVFAGEPFWGYDRLALLEQRLEEAGLAIGDKVTAA
jgi:2-hydroxychromene-2-carboxylate isomerase